RSAATEPSDLQRLAAFVRAFAATGDAGADLQPLGERHLVTLGTAVQVAAAERLVTWLRRGTDQQFQVDVRLCQVPALVFDREVTPLLQVAGGAPDRTCNIVLDATAGRGLLVALRQAAVPITQFPQVVAPHLDCAQLKVGKQLAYVRDFEIEVVQAAFLANPVIDVLFDGHQVDVLCAETRAGTLGVQLQLVDQVVEQPIPKRTTTVPGTTKEVTVEVPRVTGCRGSMTVEMSNGATALMAARKSDGSWLVTLMTPMMIRSAPAGLPARR
ncbi:MAG: hypothetical protein WBO45_17350, partial [Planctomycetota bacterium]